MGAELRHGAAGRIQMTAAGAGGGVAPPAGVSDGVISGAAACRMAGVEKAEFQFLMGERGIAQPLDESDLAQDAAGIAAWKARR